MRAWSWLPVALLILLGLGACGGGKGDDGAQIQWIEGTAPPDLLAQATGVPTGSALTQPTTPPQQVTATPSPTIPPAAETATEAVPPTATPTVAPTTPAVTDTELTADQLEQFKPNELGYIPVLEYHQFTTDASQEAQFVRTIDDFKGDLAWLYDHDFYVIPLADLVNDAIKAPAGKHPVVLTFDDSTVGQFRYLIASDGSLTIDPDSAVGIMEAFYAAHPDFGRGGFFAVLPTPNFCFSWQGASDVEEDQQPLCGQKLTWLLDHGYEVGNHTLDHQDLTDVSDDKFRGEIAGAIELFKTYDPRIEANIMAMPLGQYPDLDKHQQQRQWLRNGFSWDGQDYRIVACLQVGDGPTESPDNTDYDPIFIARIQAFDKDANVTNGEGTLGWFPTFESNPEKLYTSDGNPDVITVPNDDDLAVDFQGKLNTDKIEAEGKKLVRY